MAVRRIILTLSATLFPTSGVVRIDAPGFDRSPTSKRYTKRAELTIQQLKVTLLVDTKVHTTLELHVTTTRESDRSGVDQAQAENIDILLGDKAHDNQKIR